MNMEAAGRCEKAKQRERRMDMRDSNFVTNQTRGKNKRECELKKRSKNKSRRLTNRTKKKKKDPIKVDR